MYEYAFLIVSSIGMVLFSAKSCTEKQDAEVCIYYLTYVHLTDRLKSKSRKTCNYHLPDCLKWLESTYCNLLLVNQNWPLRELQKVE